MKYGDLVITIHSLIINMIIITELRSFEGIKGEKMKHKKVEVQIKTRFRALDKSKYKLGKSQSWIN